MIVYPNIPKEMHQLLFKVNRTLILSSLEVNYSLTWFVLRSIFNHHLLLWASSLNLQQAHIKPSRLNIGLPYAEFVITFTTG